MRKHIPGYFASSDAHSDNGGRKEPDDQTPRQALLHHSSRTPCPAGATEPFKGTRKPGMSPTPGLHLTTYRYDHKSLSSFTLPPERTHWQSSGRRHLLTGQEGQAGGRARWLLSHSQQHRTLNPASDLGPPAHCQPRKPTVPSRPSSCVVPRGPRAPRTWPRRDVLGCFS